ncbi:CHASE3 domain-containing protein [Vibrio lentus]|nr:CHASE3 domain-containing protein [Vibrio lentus]
MFLEPYHRTLDVWNQKVNTLKTDQISDNPIQVERLNHIDALHEAWLTEAGEKEIAQHAVSFSNSKHHNAECYRADAETNRKENH